MGVICLKMCDKLGSPIIFIDVKPTIYPDLALLMLQCGVAYLEGEYCGDELCGKARVQLQDLSWCEAFYKGSVLHGFARKFNKDKVMKR